jgi:hypothetical protein
MCVDYLTDLGLRRSPVAAALGKNQKYWRSHAGRTARVISCVATSLAALPPLPALDSQQENDVPVAWRCARFLTPIADGAVGYGVLLIMAYELQGMIQLGVDSLDFGASPLITANTATLILNPANFLDNLAPSSAVQNYAGAVVNF